MDNISKTGISLRNYTLILLVSFLVLFIALAINPLDRHDWMLENLIAVIMLVVLITTASKFPFSKISYTLIFLFLCLHEIGAHYTYSNVPYDQWFDQLFGQTFNSIWGWERNHFDRLVHFSYGLLLAYPIREVFLRVANVQGFWGYMLPLDVTMSTSMIFELFEWGAAEFFGGDLGIAYLGSQGDVWDAHKDMGLATCGAIIAMLITALLNVYLQRDFAREWAESLRIKEKSPLGEVAIKELLEKKNRKS